MAKKSTRRGREKFNWTTCQGEMALGALVDGIAVKDTLTGAEVLQEDAYIKGFYGYIGIRNHTAGEGPIAFGFCHNAVTTTQLAAQAGIENQFDIQDSPTEAGEKAVQSFIRRRGMFIGRETDEGLNSGDHGSQKFYDIKISMGEGTTPALWALNTSGSTLTTGTMVEWFGLLVWKYRPRGRQR